MKKDSEDWDNGTNDAFYNYLGQTGALEEFAKQAGLNTCCDFETMQAIGWLPSEKKRSAHVLEVGGGLGRGLGWLLSNQFTRVSTIEKSVVNERRPLATKIIGNEQISGCLLQPHYFVIIDLNK